MKLKVGITYNLKKDFTRQENQPIDLLEEFDSEETVDAIRQALEGEGHEVIKLGGDIGLRYAGTKPGGPHPSSPRILEHPLYWVGSPHPLPHPG
jgi:hypothetical protein